VVRKLRAEMPSARGGAAGSGDAARAVSALRALDRAAEADEPRAVPAHRLNRVEYTAPFATCWR
jgi:hypothetical protein